MNISVSAPVGDAPASAHTAESPLTPDTSGPSPIPPVKPSLLSRFLAFARANVVLLVALTAAVVTMCFVPPDAEYLSYFDWSTLSCLFSCLAVVGALRHIKFFTITAERIVSLTGNLKICILALTYITFLGSMLIANDMALLTFLPLTCYVLHSTGQEKHMALAFILQNAAANLGGMLTPFGNPQNLYLFGCFHIPTLAFLRTMAIPFAVSIALITLLCLLRFPAVKIRVENRLFSPLPKPKTLVYLLLFLLVILAVFRVLPYYIALGVVVLALLLLDRKALWEVDYPLLLTFVCFFIFAGNMVRIPAVSSFFSSLLSWNPLLVSTLCCQVISNVPTAILLAGFTTDYRPLLLGVNIGGVGTLISSLASLITLRTFLRNRPGNVGSYLLRFTIVNFGFLLILFGVCTLTLL